MKTMVPPLSPPSMLPPTPPLVWVVGCLRGLFNPPSSPSCVQSVVGFSLMFILLPPSLRCGSGWWVLGLGFAPAPPLWCGWWGCLGFRCIDLNGFRVEGQQLGAAQTETVAQPGECRHFEHATKLRSFKSHNTDEDPRFGGAAHACDCWHF